MNTRLLRLSDSRGFTLLEALVAIGLAALVLGALASAVGSEGRSAVFQMGAADMQQNVRGSIDLFAREVRMAGYGLNAVPTTAAAPVQLPALAAGDVYAVTLRANYANIKSRGSVLAGNLTTITLDAIAAPFPTFTVGEQVAIESALLGAAEIRTIQSWTAGTGTIKLTAALANTYEAGSPVNQINAITYRLDNKNVLWRNADLVADQMSLVDLDYILLDGSKVENPSAQLPNLRAATLKMRAAKVEHGGLTPQARLDTQVRIRNLGIVREAGAGA